MKRERWQQLERVCHVAQVADPGQVGPGHRQAAWPSPGGQREVAELEAAAALGDRRPRPSGRRRPHVGDPLPGQHRDLLVPVAFRRAELQRCRVGVSGQECLGQRRPLVRSAGFLAHDRDRRLPAELAQRTGQVHRGLAAAHDEHAPGPWRAGRRAA